MTAKCCGIDLGTTYSLISIYQNNRSEIIPSADGDRTFPSYVAFTGDGVRLVGAAAKNQAAMNPKNTAYDVKRLIGRTFSDPCVQADIKHLTFQVQASPDDRPQILLADQVFNPEEISSMILSKLKEAAEAYIGESITEAVISVPAYFNDAQRQATKDAGKIAGFNVRRIINEPTAAALAYGLDRSKESNEHTVIIYDCGGGTFDVTILTLEDGVFEVKSTAGDTRLGGEDFDHRMAGHLAEEFKRRHSVDITGNYKAQRRLKNACERAKRVLSSATQANIEIESLADGVDFSTSITRARFEELCSDLFQKTLVSVKQALEDAKISTSDVDEVILVGGSSRIPKLQQILSDFFDGKKLCNSVHPDEVVAMGAAIQAAILSESSTQKDERIESIVLIDVSPLSIGVEVAGGAMAVLCPRNSTLPTEKTQSFTTFADNQTSVMIQVFEGERKFTRDCRPLGKFQLDGIPPAPKGSAQLEVKFEIDANGILTVTATERSTGIRNNITISNQKGSLTDADIQRMVTDAERFAEQDKAEIERVQAKSSLDSYIWSIRGALNESAVQQKLGAEERSTVSTAVHDALTWLDANLNASTQEFQDRRKEMESICRPLMDKVLKDAPPSSSAPPRAPKAPPAQPKIEET